MQKFHVLLSSINDVKHFSNAAAMQCFEIDVVSGRYIVNAKSIMGLFSLDLIKPLLIEADCTDSECEQFKETIRDFLVDGE